MNQIGTVKFFDTIKGFGFIAPDNGGHDAFVHISAVERSGMGTLSQNQRVSFDLEECRSFAGGAPTFRGAVCFCGARF